MLGAERHIHTGSGLTTMLGIIISGRHMDVSEKLKAYAEEKAAKLERYFDRVHKAEIVFDKEADHFVCEVIVKSDQHAPFVAKENHEDPYAALDATVKDLERQLTRQKEKLRNRKHPDGGAPREPLADITGAED